MMRSITDRITWENFQNKASCYLLLLERRQLFKWSETHAKQKAENYLKSSYQEKHKQIKLWKRNVCEQNIRNTTDLPQRLYMKIKKNFMKKEKQQENTT